MAMRCRTKIGVYRADDVMNNEKWTANQRSKSDANEIAKVELTKGFLNRLCSLVEPSYNICYSDADKLIREREKRLNALRQGK